MMIILSRIALVALVLSTASQALALPAYAKKGFKAPAAKPAPKKK